MHAPTAPTATAVSTVGLELHYGTTAILKGIDLSLPKGQTLALLGPSGCGKTTLLRLVAGLLAPTKGSITIDGKVVADAATGLFAPPERRNLGMVFQDYALWPHMSVRGNVSFPLEMRNIPKGERDSRVAAALDRVGLGSFADRRTSDMSGGQQQRVAIARAIVAEPGLVLFDEPLSNLDRELRETMVAEIGELVATLGLTAIYVTHDQSEAFSLAHQVAVMRAGVVEQLASPEGLLETPATPAVADFLRLGCVAPVELRNGHYWLRDAGVRLAPATSDAGHVLLPARHIRFSDPSSAALTGTVIRTQFRGDGHLTQVRIGDASSPHDIHVLSDIRFSAGESVGLAIDAQHLRWFS
jgi:iron(III) transport system ATP-binding protein